VWCAYVGRTNRPAATIASYVAVCEAAFSWTDAAGRDAKASRGDPGAPPPQRLDVDLRRDQALLGATGAVQDAALEVHDLRVAVADVRRQLRVEVRARVGHREVADVLPGARLAHRGPRPATLLEMLGAARLAGDVQQHLGAAQREAARDLGEVDVVADQRAEPPERRVEHREQRLGPTEQPAVFGVHVLRRGLAGQRVELAITQCDLAPRVDDERGVEKAPREGVQFLVGHAGDVHLQLAGGAAQGLDLRPRQVDRGLGPRRTSTVAR
jgi:hypothetical protein